MEPKEFLKNKKVLVVILGIYGGGAATAKWLFQNGAKVTVTDMRSEKELEGSMKLFTPKERKGIHFVLGGQHEEDFSSHDIIVLGPGVPRESPYLSVAKKAGKQIENDASLFFRFVKNPVIAVTGTRGKSTTTSWIAHILSHKYGDFIPTGNNPKLAFLKELSLLKDESRPVVAEMSSWQLEYLPHSEKAPHISVITNLTPDHLNRYQGGMEDYAGAKANIFKDQTENDILILNADNEWTKFYLSKKPKAKLYYFSKKPLTKGKNGMFIKDGKMVFRNGKEDKEILDIKKFSETMGIHNLENLLATILSITLFDPKFRITKKMIDSLPQSPFRQEIIVAKKGLTVVNDSAGTSPDATIAILRRFSTWGFNPQVTLITGGTDKDLEFCELAKEIKKTLTPSNLVLLNGSATTKLILELKKIHFWNNPSARLRAGKKILLFETLEECTDFALGMIKSKPAVVQGYRGRRKRTILFSPGSASFEKFRNEFHRGERFNTIIQSLL
ncbi:MAG: UDP-N-acetylmuramoyl-L-alanine--D-glutamate ligase [Candidatus Parcubacteria bacterium]|nr:UDP-N-acetylmuramoyl-L-alanine--D-glutamate ligase [Candidatus Parcubacteria bacterium]